MSDEVPEKFPKACGCAGPRYVSMCELHQEEERAAHRRRMGMDRIPIASPSALCGLIGCARQDSHSHAVVP